MKKVETTGLATTISKLYERYILYCISPFVAISDNQFVIEPHHGTYICLFLFKQIVLFYETKVPQYFQPFEMNLRHLTELTTMYCLLQVQCTNVHSKIDAELV